MKQERLGNIILTDVMINNIVEKTGRQINNYYLYQKEVICIILNGAKKFTEEMKKYMNNINKYRFIYVETEEDFDKNCYILSGKSVLLVEDVCRSGKNLYKYVEKARLCKCLDIKTCVFIKKDKDTIKDLSLDFVGVIVREEGFLAGYGLQSEDVCEELPCVVKIQEN